jgi:hypothetical protein
LKAQSSYKARASAITFALATQIKKSLRHVTDLPSSRYMLLADARLFAALAGSTVSSDTKYSSENKFNYQG